MIDFNQYTRRRKLQQQFAKQLRASNFSPDLFRDTFEGPDPERYKAIRTFQQLRPEQKYKMTYNVGWAMRTVSWIRFQYTFKRLKAHNSEFPRDLYERMLDPNIPNEYFLEPPPIEDRLTYFLICFEGVKTRILNMIFRD